MRLFDADPSIRWLFCMTHPDDEISICAWIRQLTDVGADVFISWTHHNPVRLLEGERAAEMLGVGRDRLFIHNGEDGRICDQMPTLLEPFRAMVQEVAPDRICCGAFEQGHLDHDATNLLVNLSFEGPIQEIPFYHTYLTRRPIVNRFSEPANEEIYRLSEGQRAFKKSFAKMYPSQGIFRNLVLAEARQRFLLGGEPLYYTERMRLQVSTDFLAPALSPHLADRVRSSDKWRRWESAARAIL